MTRRSYRDHDWASYPFAYTTSEWIAGVIDVDKATVESIRLKRRYLTALSMSDRMGFPDRPASWRPWILAWGADRIRAFLTPRSAKALAQFEQVLPLVFDDAHDAACRREKRLASMARWRENRRKKEARETVVRRVDLDLSQHPAGLIPDNLIASASGVPEGRVQIERKKAGIGPAKWNRRARFPANSAAWIPWVEAWGEDRVRAYVAKHFPYMLSSFNNRNVAPPPKPEPERRVVKVKQVAKAPASPPKPERPAAFAPIDITKRELTFTPIEVKRNDAEAEAEAIRRFIQSRGVTKVAGAGSGAPVGTVLGIERRDQ